MQALFRTRAVSPAKAGAQEQRITGWLFWTPAFAGETDLFLEDHPHTMPVFSR